MVMLEVSCSFMVYIINQSCIQVFGTTTGESEQLSNSSDINFVYRKGHVLIKFLAPLLGTE